jgi:hypothetical protein
MEIAVEEITLDTIEAALARARRDRREHMRALLAALSLRLAARPSPKHPLPQGLNGQLST